MTFFGTEIGIAELVVGLIITMFGIVIAAAVGMLILASNRSKGGVASSTTSTKPSKVGSGLTHPAVIALLFSAFAIALFTYWGDLRNTFSSASNQSTGKTTYWVISVGVLLAFALSRKFTWLKSPLFFGVIVAIGYFWSNIRGAISTWIDSQGLGVTNEMVDQWLWVVPVAIVVVFVLRKLKLNFGELTTLLTVAIVAMISWSHFGGSGNKEGGLEKYETPSEISDSTVTEETKTLRVKKGDKLFMLCVRNSNHQIIVELAEHEKALHKEWNAGNLISYHTQDGGPNCQWFGPIETGFRRTGAKYIDFVFRLKK